jgi:hypothetical protein
MSIIINNFSIINDGQSLAIDVETNVGFNISHINLWKMDNFKDYSLAYSLDYKLEGINNKEVFIVTNAEFGVNEFTDLYFIEINSTYEEELDVECSSCQIPGLGITYNLGNYYQCLLSYFLESNIGNCTDCGNDSSIKIINTINLLLDMVENAIEIGYYTQAILMIKKLKKLCLIKNCKGCKPISCNSCNKFKQY